MAPLYRWFGVFLTALWVSGCIPQFDSSTDCETVTDCFKGERCDVIKGCVPMPDSGTELSEIGIDQSDAEDGAFSESETADMAIGVDSSPQPDLSMDDARAQ